jgi:CheY-like chemotaxis protein
VRVAVQDSGLGIPEQQQDKLFQPFQRAGQETGSIEGTGIGLAITKRLAELMNGTVGFRSTPGHGSNFWVDMPVYLSSARPSTLPPSLLADSGLAQCSGNVLYVEDNPANVRLLRDLLENFQTIELITAPTAEIGLDLARTLLPNVIIMDINLPGISGFEALRKLKEWPETRDIPVIALTAAASERDRQRGEQAGFFRYLTKPVKIAELEAALEQLLVS